MVRSDHFTLGVSTGAPRVGAQRGTLYHPGPPGGGWSKYPHREWSNPTRGYIVWGDTANTRGRGGIYLIKNNYWKSRIYEMNSPGTCPLGPRGCVMNIVSPQGDMVLVCGRDRGDSNGEITLGPPLHRLVLYTWWDSQMNLCRMLSLYSGAWIM